MAFLGFYNREQLNGLFGKWWQNVFINGVKMCTRRVDGECEAQSVKPIPGGVQDTYIWPQVGYNCEKTPEAQGILVLYMLQEKIFSRDIYLRMQFSSCGIF